MMNVQELIDRLLLVENKSLPVCLVNGYAPHCEVGTVEIKNDQYETSGGYKLKEGTFVCLGDI